MSNATTTSIPTELIDLPHWVLWKHAQRNGKETKVPFQVNGVEAKSNDSSTWTTFDNAAAASHNYEGVGFMFSVDDEFCGIDLDGCRDPDTGIVSEWASTWIDKFDSYTEVSPSRTGVKIFVTGKNPLAKGKNLKLDEPVVSDKKPGVEIYDKGRYFAVTAKRLPEYPATCEPRQEVIDRFCRHYWPKLFETPKPARKPTRTRGARLTVEDRAAKYLAKIPGAVSGSGGHNATYHAACVLVLGFDLSPEQAFPLLSEWNAKCEPPWSEGELRHKLDSANTDSGERGYAVQHRNEIIGELCGMVERWKAVGMQLASTQSRFNKKGWGNIIGGILDANGEPDFLMNASEAAEQMDSVRREFGELVEAMANHPQGSWTGGELVGLADQHGLLRGELGEGSQRSKSTRMGVLATRYVAERFEVEGSALATFNKRSDRNGNLYSVGVVDDE